MRRSPCALCVLRLEKTFSSHAEAGEKHLLEHAATRGGFFCTDLRVAGRQRWQAQLQKKKCLASKKTGA